MAKIKQERIASIEEEIMRLENQRKRNLAAKKSETAKTERDAFVNAWG